MKKKPEETRFPGDFIAYRDPNPQRGQKSMRRAIINSIGKKGGKTVFFLDNNDTCQPKDVIRVIV